MNVDLLLTLLISVATHAGEISALITKARAEKRDVTDAELQALLDADNLARARAVVAVAEAKAAGR